MSSGVMLWLQIGFISYFALLNLGYMVLNILSLISLRQYMRYRTDLGGAPQWLGVEPPVSVIVPAYNEETTITASVRSMLQLQYPEYEVIVVNDGSGDSTLETLRSAFEMEPVPAPIRLRVPCQPIRGYYRSRRYPELTLIDKQNGGKADALNAGINAAQFGLFCGVDADSILQRDSLLRVVQPFLEDEHVIAAGGTVRIANGSQVRGGFLVKAALPGNLLAQFQIVEYLRAFLFGRLGWSPINGLLIISGAFGLFDRERVVEVGGYRTDTVGEDMELVVRLHHWCRNHKRRYRIAYVPDPICWTEAPEDLGTLGRQRSRWQRGLSESLAAHRGLLLHRRGGAPGWLAYPFMAVFEWFGPVIELLGFIVIIGGYLLGLLSVQALFAFLLVAVGLGIMLSVNGLLLESLSFRIYSRRRDMLRLFLMAVLENVGYRQLNTLWRLRGLWQWLRRSKGGWGRMQRRGTWSQ